MKVEDGLFTVLKGSICCPTNASWVPAARKGAIIKNNVLMEDVECSSPSTAAWIPTGSRNSGWYVWKTETGKPIDIFRKIVYIAYLMTLALAGVAFSENFSCNAPDVVI